MSREAVLSSRIEGTQGDFMDLFAYTAESPHKTSASKTLMCVRSTTM